MSQKISIDLSAFQNNDSFMAEEHVMVHMWFFLLVHFVFHFHKELKVVFHTL